MQYCLAMCVSRPSRLLCPQNGRGYGIDEPGKADLSIASNAVGQKFKCALLTPSRLPDRCAHCTSTS